MSKDRMALVGKQLRKIKEEMANRSPKEIAEAMDKAYAEATDMHKHLSLETEELFIVFTLGWFMYAADIATTREDHNRSRFAAMAHTEPFLKNERQKVKETGNL